MDHIHKETMSQKSDSEEEQAVEAATQPSSGWFGSYWGGASSKAQEPASKKKAASKMEKAATEAKEEVPKPSYDLNVIYMSQVSNILIKVFRVAKLQQVQSNNKHSIFKIYDDNIFLAYDKHIYLFNGSTQEGENLSTIIDISRLEHVFKELRL